MAPSPPEQLLRSTTPVSDDMQEKALVEQCARHLGPLRGDATNLRVLVGLAPLNVFPMISFLPVTC